MTENLTEGSSQKRHSRALGSTSKPSGKPGSEIRAIRRDDIEEIVALSQDSFPGSRSMSPESIRKALSDLYFHPVHSDKEIPSLVSRSVNGEVDGFLGVRTERFTYNGRTVVVANCHHLMATLQARSQLVPMKILQQFLGGGQDLSFADGSAEATRLLWKRLGGDVSYADSLYYKIPLRPISFGARISLKSIPEPVKRIIQSLSFGVDALGNQLALPLFRRKRPDIRMDILSPERLLKGLEKLHYNYSLMPDYNDSKIDYLFSMLEFEQKFGLFHRVVLYNNQNKIQGWFLYYSNKGGVCEVIQAVSVPGSEPLLYEAITWHAFEQGGVELSGRLMASQLKSPLATRSVCMPGRMWTLVHSRHQDLKNCILSGQAFLTRLEGDLWLL